MKPDFTIDPDSLPALATFTRVAQLGGFTAALGVSPSAISQTIRHLEDQLGVRLLQRTTRRVGLMEAGAALLARGSGTGRNPCRHRRRAPAARRAGGHVAAH